MYVIILTVKFELEDCLRSQETTADTSRTEQARDNYYGPLTGNNICPIKLPAILSDTQRHLHDPLSVPLVFALTLSRNMLNTLVAI